MQRILMLLASIVVPSIIFLLGVIYRTKLLLSAIICHEAVSTESPSTLTVSNKCGKIRGSLEKVLNKEVFAFYGVPFAKPPWGGLRFKPPEPLVPWKGVFTANRLCNACVQERDDLLPGFKGTEMWNSNTPVSEDCLCMNIWVPRNSINATVMMWIFGGGFQSGSPSLSLYNASVLAAETNVIVVNINYRVGPLGFLYFNNNDAPGNMGLLDQQMALRWIYDNIEAFGGNRKRITLFGESAGSASVASHLIAPNSQAYVNSVILQSGSINAQWASNSPANAESKSRQLAEMLGCAPQNVSNFEIIKCLRQLPASDISKAAANLNNTEFLEFPFRPVNADANFFKRSNSFDDSLTAGRFKRTPVLIGMVKDEGSYWMPYLSELFRNGGEGQVSRSQYLDIIHKIFGSRSSSPIVHNAIAFHYARPMPDCAVGSNKNESVIFRNGINHIISDFFFNCDLVKFGRLLGGYGSRVFAYYFTQRSSFSPWPLWFGSTHGYEIEYVFGAPLLRTLQSDTQAVENGASVDDARLAQEQAFSRLVMKHWTEFAKTGKPSKDWPSFTENNRAYVELSANASLVSSDIPHTERLTVRYNLKASDCKFWSTTIAAHLKVLEDAEDAAADLAFAETSEAKPTKFAASKTAVVIFVVLMLQLFSRRSLCTTTPNYYLPGIS